MIRVSLEMIILDLITRFPNHTTMEHFFNYFKELHRRKSSIPDFHEQETSFLKEAIPHVMSITTNGTTRIETLSFLATMYTDTPFIAVYNIICDTLTKKIQNG